MPDLLDAARRVVESSRWDDPDNHPPGTRPAPDRKAVDDLEAALEAYQWSDEPPEEPGWYWMRNNTTTLVKRIYPSHSGLYFVASTGGHVFLHDPKLSDNQWAGPIPEPTDTE